MGTLSRAELEEACRALFGHRLDPSFLDHVQESGLRAAWRRAALRWHPDRVPGAAAKRESSERFIEARQAYGLLREHLGRRGRQPLPAAPPPRRTARPAARPTSQAPPREDRRARPHRAGAHRREAAARGAQPVPRRRLRLGEFLYHAGVISFGALVESIVWQRRQRERFCEIGLRWGYLTETQVRLLLGSRPLHEPVGAAALRLGLLSGLQVRTVLAFQRSRQQPLGGYFVRRGLFTPVELARLLERLALHNAAVAGPAGR